MTVSTEVDHNEYTGNGVTVSFPYTFRIYEKDNLIVQTVDLSENINILTLDVDYTITEAGKYSGGNVVLTNPLVTGWRISISRSLPVTQETDLRNQGKFFAEVHEDAFDKLTMLIQQVRSSFNLALRKPSFVANYYDALSNYIRNLRDPSRPQDAATKNYVDSLATTNFSRTLRTPELITSLPAVEQRKNKIIAMDNSGNPMMILPESGSAADVLIELAKPSGYSLIGQAESIDELRNIEPIFDGQEVILRGYYSGTIKGAGIFVGRISQDGYTEDYGVVIFSSGGGIWERKISADKVDAFMFGAIGDGVADDTIALQRALDSSRVKEVEIPGGYIFTVGDAVRVRSGKTLQGSGILKAKSGNPSVAVVFPESNSTILGIKVDGGGFAVAGVASSSSSNVVLDGVSVANAAGGPGIVNYTSGSNFVIRNCVVNNCSGPGISLEYTNNSIISGNTVDTALHGIQWYGGDSNLSSTIGIDNIIISGNKISNVKGGIWGSLGSNITVSDNTVKDCTDVGIDFEGCLHCIASGNVAINCANGCYAVFFGSKNISIVGNSAFNSTSTSGAGFYATTNSSYTNEEIIISGNIFQTYNNCISVTQQDRRSLINSNISNNILTCTGGSPAILLLRAGYIQITNNVIVTNSSPCGISLQGSYSCLVSQNRLSGYADPGQDGVGGIWLYQQTSDWSSESNRIIDNDIIDYTRSIVDACAIDVTKSYNLIRNNHVSNLYRSAGNTYTGLFSGNTYRTDPNIPVEPVPF